MEENDLPTTVGRRQSASVLLEHRLTAAVRDMALHSSHLTALGGDAAEVQRMLDDIENLWLDVGGVRIHLDFHASREPKATIVFQPGSGAHARVYFLLGGLLAKRGYHVLAIDRPGHGLSGGTPGDCTVEEGITVAESVMTYARLQLGRPVVLMGSSMGGLLTIFGLLKGLQPHLAVAHNFVYPGKLLSMRLRSRWITRRRTKPYPLTELVHGFETLSPDPAIVPPEPVRSWCRLAADPAKHREPLPLQGPCPGGWPRDARRDRHERQGHSSIGHSLLHMVVRITPLRVQDPPERWTPAVPRSPRSISSTGCGLAGRPTGSEVTMTQGSDSLCSTSVPFWRVGSCPTSRYSVRAFG